MREWEERERICGIGSRAWQRQFVSANEGNISVRISEGEVLTTPTLVSKGFMKPEDICKVDMEGKTLQAAPGRKPTSEVLLHLNVYKERPDVRAAVHVHPPHATAFAVAGEPIPKCILPEVEIFVGEIPIAEYASPGTPDLFKTITPFLKDHDSFLLANHGALTIGKDLLDAFYKMELVESYCRILLILKQLGGFRRLSPEHMKHLFAIKEKMGLHDPRKHCDICEACSEAVSSSQGTLETSLPPGNDIIRRIVEEVLRTLGQ